MRARPDLVEWSHSLEIAAIDGPPGTPWRVFSFMGPVPASFLGRQGGRIAKRVESVFRPAQPWICGPSNRMTVWQDNPVRTYVDGVGTGWWIADGREEAGLHRRRGRLECEDAVRRGPCTTHPESGFAIPQHLTRTTKSTASAPGEKRRRMLEHACSGQAL